MFTIYIDRLRVFARHGVYDFEKENGQYFLFWCEADANVAVQEDDISHSVDYTKLISFIEGFIGSTRFELLETLLLGLMRAVMDEFPEIESVRARICKESAPVDAKLSEVGIKGFLSRSEVYLSLGTNMGGRMDNLKAAIRKIDALPSCRVVSVSKVYETSPVGYKEQSDFLNCCVKLSTILSPDELLSALLAIEDELGRVRTFKNAPRVIDIDVLLYDELVTLDERLTLPHPRMLERKFVLVPLLDVYDSSLERRLYYSCALSRIKSDDTVSFFGDIDL